MSDNTFRKKKAGMPPGTLVHVGKRKAEKIKITVLDYTTEIFDEKELSSVDDCGAYKHQKTASWINIDGLHDTDAIAAIGQKFELHPLLLEDVLNTNHRPKVDEFDHCIFITLKMLGISKDRKSIVSEQVSFVLGEGWVISFQEQQGDIFDALRERIREGKGLVRERSADYLLYRLIDIIVDNYFYITDYLDELIEKLEAKVLIDQSNDNIIEIQQLKKEVTGFRKAVFPLREVISFLLKGDNTLIEKNTIRYFQDVYEHIIQVSDVIETNREMLSSIRDLHMSGVSNRMNQIMQVLTIMSSIFIPLTFIAGIYGMNFEFMPELKWKYGYFATWGAMFALTTAMMIFFRRKKWM